ncbi:16S rRNA (cytosine(1402)-N(4))-methyltransferase RsmH [Candidatus Saccharibacteria bacterium]|nr:16S rRNA (cytosine(1402)-N(4))-methyltransferase RsmH [Candidatus Saccharibacteria bacterium]
MEELHQPVMLKEVLEVLNPKPGESYIDLTAGYAGHASKILDVTRNYKEAVLIDRDEFACEILKEKYAQRESIKIVNSDFYSAALQEIQCGNSFDLLLADFGVSSPQLDEEKRGFSFAKTGPLDMRMDQKQKLTAADIVNKWSERELTEIFIKYGEEKPGQARIIAREIVHNRPYNTTAELATVIAAKGRRNRMTHPATRIFQAIRIVVNDELDEIERTLPLIPRLLRPGGRAAFITFHSLEDRLVKNYLTEATSYGVESELEIINKKPLVAGKGELVINPRARSAKLRACRRV